MVLVPSPIIVFIEKLLSNKNVFRNIPLTYILTVSPDNIVGEAALTAIIVSVNMAPFCGDTIEIDGIPQ